MASTEARQYAAGASVSVHWGTGIGYPVTFTISQGGTVLYSETGQGGSYSYASDGQPYVYAASVDCLYYYYCPTLSGSEWGTWAAPIL